MPSPRLPIPSHFAGKSWQQVLARDPAADGRFVYAVKTTRIYCRPSCPSRRPDRKNVAFYPTPAQAEAAGFRPCLRCEPQRMEPRPDPQIAAIDAVSSYLTEHAAERTRLKDVAEATGVSPLTILRGFKRVLGVTPREFAKGQRVLSAREKVRSPAASVTPAGDTLMGNNSGSGTGSGTGDDAGFEPQSHLQGDAERTPGMSPTALRHGGRGERIRYTVASSPLGEMLVAATARGLCAVTFADSPDTLLAELRQQFPNAELRQMDSELSYAVKAVIASMRESSAAAQALSFDVRATAFQQRVWRALQRIPRGETRTYTQLAEAVGAPNAARAVASACARNPLAVLVPCHRVVGKGGTLTGYRWGLERKRQLLALEAAEDAA